MKKGISMVALIATVVIMSIILTTIVVSGVASSDNAKRMAFGSELSFIQESVDAYYTNNNELPISDLVQIDTTNVIAANIQEQFASENIVSNKLSLYVVDYTKLGISNLKYGTKNNSDSTDVYAVSQTTNKVYYVKGLRIGSKVYFTLTDDLKKSISYSTGTTSTFVKNGIVFIPSTTKWTKDPVTASVKVPKTYTVNSVTAKAGSSTYTFGTPDTTSDTNYNIYSVTGVQGNYDIDVSYTESSNSFAVKYSIDNFDNSPPSITLDDSNQKIMQNSYSGTSYAYFNVTAKSDNESGVKIVKYENETIPANNMAAYFKSNGKIVKNDTVQIDKNVSYLTVYIEDNAGNWTAKWVTVDSAIYSALIKQGLVYPSVGVGVIATSNSTINGQLPTYYNPIIPVGFKAIDTTDSSWTNISTDWNKGLVIQDSNGNEFVWVPVDGSSVIFQKWCNTGIGYTDANLSDDTNPAGYSESNITDLYKGFYIARYEAMFDYNGGNTRAASKKSTNKTTSSWYSARDSAHNGYLFNYINYADAKTYAESMATKFGYDTSRIGTNLMTGKQWDTVMKWVQNGLDSVTDSRTWGNYSNSLSPANVSGYGNIQISGYSENWKKKNIYDLAGSVHEWNSEIYSTNSIVRGGSYNESGITNPASYRGSQSGTFANVSFRIALFIK